MNGHITLRVEAFPLIAVPVLLIAVEVFSPIAFTFSFSLRQKKDVMNSKVS